jgi:hypothetical protein
LFYYIYIEKDLLSILAGLSLITSFRLDLYDNLSLPTLLTPNSVGKF